MLSSSFRLNNIPADTVTRLNHVSSDRTSLSIFAKLVDYTSVYQNTRHKIVSARAYSLGILLPSSSVNKLYALFFTNYRTYVY